MQMIAVLVATLVGGLFALLHGYAAITLKANQIISGTAINILASGIALFFATSGFFGPNSTDITTNFTPIYIDPSQVIPL
jgi:simple sugar transport system permease protein